MRCCFCSCSKNFKTSSQSNTLLKIDLTLDFSLISLFASAADIFNQKEKREEIGIFCLCLCYHNVGRSYDTSATFVLPISIILRKNYLPPYFTKFLHDVIGDKFREK